MIFKKKGSSIKKTNTLSKDELIKYYGLNSFEFSHKDKEEVFVCSKFKEFDLIECGGVLHHMNNPSQGLKALVSVLKNNGFLKLGLYSELARQDIVKARNYITSKNLQANEDVSAILEKLYFQVKHQN